MDVRVTIRRLEQGGASVTVVGRKAGKRCTESTAAATWGEVRGIIHEVVASMDSRKPRLPAP